MTTKNEIDFKFPVKALEPVTLDGVKSLPGEVFDARTQHIRDYLVDRAKSAVDHRPADSAVEERVTTAIEEPAGDPPATLDAAPEKVDSDEHQDATAKLAAPEGAGSGGQSSSKLRWRQ